MSRLTVIISKPVGRTMTDRKLLKRLQDAYQCCDKCGEEYGSRRSTYSTYWHGVCHVCGLEMAVTETRDWGYLHLGIASISAPAAT